MPEQLALHPAPVGCRACGTILQASHAAEADFCCPACAEPACYTCGCVELHACCDVVRSVDGRRAVESTCSWLAPGLCSFCGSRAAYELYMDATGRSASDPFYLDRAPSCFCVRGLGAGIDRLGVLEARFQGGRV